MKLLRPDEWTKADDRIVLRADQRRVRRKRLVSEGGTGVVVAFEHTRTLRPGEAIEADGWVFEIVGAQEDLLALTSPKLVELAWHIGNRHLAAQILDEEIVIVADPVIERMVRGLGAEVRAFRGVFDPAHGAYHEAVHEH